MDQQKRVNTQLNVHSACVRARNYFTPCLFPNPFVYQIWVKNSEIWDEAYEKDLTLNKKLVLKLHLMQHSVIKRRVEFGTVP